MAPADCVNFSVNASAADKFEISNECALFDFAVYTLVVGLMIVFGVVGNALSFIVMTDLVSVACTSFKVVQGHSKSGQKTDRKFRTYWIETFLYVSSETPCLS